MFARRIRGIRGFTLIEMVLAIVIISVGLAGVLLAFNTAVKSSADPLIDKQMLAAAEEMIEEVLLKPYAVSGTAPSNSPKKCDVSPLPSREAFDDVSDYDGYQTTGVCTIEGALVTGLGGYSVKVKVEPSAGLTGITVSNAKKVTVTVEHGATEALTLVGWRTWYACELPTVCPP